MTVQLKSLITELPKIVERSKRQAQRILDSLSKRNRIILQTNELVLPTRFEKGFYSLIGQPVKKAICLFRSIRTPVSVNIRTVAGGYFL